MWKALIGFFGGGGDGKSASPRARKPRARKAKKAPAKKLKVIARPASKAAVASRSRKASGKRRASRKPKFVWPTEPTKAARRPSKPVADGQEDDPSWSQPTQPLL